MRKIEHPENVRQWGYFDARLGRGFTGTRDHIVMQAQEAYLRAGVDFHEHEIPALVDNYMCEQGLASPCSERIAGLGDIVHAALHPIARISDTLFGTKYAQAGGCSGCNSRREALNKAVPL